MITYTFSFDNRRITTFGKGENRRRINLCVWFYKEHDNVIKNR